MNNTLAWVLPAEIPPLSRYLQGLQQSFRDRALFPPVLTALILVIISCWGRLEIGLGWWVSAEWITSISPLGGPHTDKVRKNGFGFSLSIHGFLVEKWNFPTEGTSVPTVSVHGMFHLLLLFWKCNYLRYRGPKWWQFGRRAVPLAKGISRQRFCGVRRSFGLKLFPLFPPVRRQNNLLIDSQVQIMNRAYECSYDRLSSLVLLSCCSRLTMERTVLVRHVGWVFFGQNNE